MCRTTGKGVNLLSRWMSEVTWRARTMPLTPSESVHHVPPLTCGAKRMIAAPVTLTGADVYVYSSTVASKVAGIVMNELA